jgi:membrane associated rhomboid family serine protease
MIEDRDYMRQPEYQEPRWTPSFRFRWSWTLALLLVNVVVFVVECVTCGYPPAFSENNYFALSVEGIQHGYVWQFLTFQFMHANLLHIFFNSWTIYVFGRHLEMEIGPRKFLALYFSSGIIGGVFQILGGVYWPNHFGVAVVGASAGAMGLMAAFAVLNPEELLTVLIVFFPVNIRAKYLVIGIALLSVLCILLPNSVFTAILGGNVSNAAHLGGMVMGWCFVRFILQGDWSRLGGFLHPAEKRTIRRPASEPVATEPAGGFVESEVDPILDKISAHGLSSLTPREREILENARKHIRRS